MDNYYIVDDGKTQLLKFKKLDEFKDKVELVYSLKAYDNGFKYDLKENSIVDVRLTKFDKIAQSLNIDKRKIILPKQEHTDNIRIIEEKDIIDDKNNCIKEKRLTDKEKVLNNQDNFTTKDSLDIVDSNLVTNLFYKLRDIDGLITNVKCAILATTFADCTPLFFYDPIKNVIGNIHSGWPGTTKKIGAKAIDMLVNKMGCNPKNILCFIGPHIRKECFLVNDDVKEIFEKTFMDICKNYNVIEETNMHNEKGKQYRIDTTLINKIMLKEKGILEENIYDCNLCTVCNKDMFHSRRAEGINYEVNTGIMYLK